MIWSILHSASQVLLLAGLLSVFITTLILWKRVRRSMRTYYEQSKLIASPFAGKPNSGRTPTIERVHRNWPSALVIVAGLSLLGNAVLIWREFHNQTYVEMRDVHVLRRNGDYVFQMDVEDPQTHQRNPFMIRFCPDYKPTEEMQAGTVLTLLKYERRDFCELISPNEMGYILRRDKNGQPIRFEPGQAETTTTQ